ncbi:1117_t:CDS:2, partial [Scutellospora calospora]
KEKQGKDIKIKKPHSERLRNIGCSAIIGFCIEKHNLKNSHPLEVSLKFTHNHIPKSAVLLSFHLVYIQTKKEYLKLFEYGYIPSTTHYKYEEKLYLLADNEKNLATILADHQLKSEVKNYNKLERGKAAFCLFDKTKKQVFVLYIVSNLMQRIHKTIQQAGIILISDESENTFEFAFNFLKTVLPNKAFYNRRPEVGLTISNQHPERMHIIEKFLCYKHKNLNLEGILHREDDITYDVPSTTVVEKMYIVDPTIGTCSCLVGISGAPCSIVQERSFYASLRPQMHLTSNNSIVDQLKIQETSISKFTLNTEVDTSEKINFIVDTNNNEKLNTEIDPSEKINYTEDTNNNEELNRIESLTSFFHEVENDIRQNTQLLSAFEKFQKGYYAAKSLSENRLVSFIYQHANSPITVRNSTKIPVQVASVQRRKGAVSHSLKRKTLGRQPLDNKENENPLEMQPRKKRKTMRKPYNLAQNINNNRAN